MRRLLFALALLACTTGMGPAQSGGAPTGDALPQAQGVPPLSSQAQVSLLTILPGDSPASAFGHSALRVRDPARGLDRTYNYGTYNFRDPYFIPKFVYGQLTYLVVAHPLRPFLRRYRQIGRPVIEQELRLSPAQAQRLFAFLEWNTQPGNRAYEYDFLFDNCATRIRDALRDALGARLRFEKAALPRRSFREHLDRFVAGMPLLDFGFDLGLGLPVERTAAPEEAMFLPEYLMEGFAGATVGSGASRQPLVTRTDTLFWERGAQFPARTAFPWVTLGAWALFAAGAGLTGWRWVRGCLPLAWPDVLLFGAVGLGGVVVWFLAFLSEHEVTRQNLNVVWMWPTHLLFAGALLLKRGTGRLARGYLLAGGAAALVLAGGWPLWPQDLHAAAFPLVALVALRSARRGLPLLFRTAPRRKQRKTS